MKNIIPTIISERESVHKIKVLFERIDLLESLGGANILERRNNNQRYQYLRRNILSKRALNKYDLGMLKRTSKYDFCLI